MDKSTQTFIDNAGKATQKKEVWFDAYKPTVRSGDTSFTFYGIICYGLAAVVTIAIVIGLFITYQQG